MGCDKEQQKNDWTKGADLFARAADIVETKAIHQSIPLSLILLV